MSDYIRLNKEEYIKVLYDKREDRFYYIKAVNKNDFRFGSDVFW